LGRNYGNQKQIGGIALRDTGASLGNSFGELLWGSGLKYNNFGVMGIALGNN